MPADHTPLHSLLIVWPLLQSLGNNCPQCSSGLMRDSEQASKTADAFQKAGVILTLGNTVYLRPTVVAGMVFRVGGVMAHW